MTTAPEVSPKLGFRGRGPSYQDLLDTDSKPVPASYRRDEPGDFGSADIPVERYLSRAWHEKEKAQLWSRVWQFACREEVLAEVGDTEVYDICDDSFLLVRRSARGAGSSSSTPLPTAGRSRSSSASCRRCSSAGRSRTATPAPTSARSSAPTGKVVREAFLESYHVVTTHPQLLPGFGDANTQYDVFGNAGRGISPRGIPSPYLAWSPSEQEKLNSAIDQRVDDPEVLTVREDETARSVPAEAARRSIRSTIGDRADELSDAELVDSCYLSVFPDFHPWGAYNQIVYRFRPNGDDHESSVMDCLLLAPFAGDRPPPAPHVQLSADQPWRDAVEVLGSLARVFDQDEFDLEAVQKGLKASRKPGVTLALYQESLIRHFHALPTEWTQDPATGR